MMLIGSAVVLFIWFLAAMYFLRNRHELRKKTGPVYFLIVILILLGAAFDVAFNWTFGILIFGEITRDLMLTKRLGRYREQPEYAGSWRMRWADWICEHLLNPYDPTGKHC